MRSSAVFADSRGSGVTPAPRSATKATPLLSSITTPTATSPMVGSEPSGAAATDTQQDSRPASAGRVPSIGSTISTHSASPPEGETMPRSSE